MIPVVLDTNIMVSALWTENGNAARIIQMFISGAVRLYYDAQILAEYKSVLRRRKFAFSGAIIDELIASIGNDGAAYQPVSRLHGDRAHDAIT